MVKKTPLKCKLLNKGNQIPDFNKTLTEISFTVTEVGLQMEGM
jgi:hypothetical protein